MKRLGLVGAALFMTFLALRTFAAPAGREGPVTLTVRYWEQLAADGQQKTLNEISVRPDPDGRFRSISGGESTSRVGGKNLESGVRLTGRIDRDEEGGAVIEFVLASGSPIAQEKEVLGDVVRTEGIEIRTKMKVGERCRLWCGGERWCDVRLEE